MNPKDIILTLKFTDAQYMNLKKEFDLLRLASVNKSIPLPGIASLFREIKYTEKGWRIYVSKVIGNKALQELFNCQDLLKDKVKFPALNSLYATLYKGVNNLPL